MAQVRQPPRQIAHSVNGAALRGAQVGDQMERRNSAFGRHVVRGQRSEDRGRTARGQRSEDGGRTARGQRTEVGNGGTTGRRDYGTTGGRASDF